MRFYNDDERAAVEIDTAIYPRLHDTVIVTWLLSLPVTRCFPSRRRGRPGIGMPDAVSELSAVALANHDVFDVAAGLAVTGIGYLVACRPRALPLLYRTDSDVDPRALGARSAQIIAVSSGPAAAALDRAGELHAG